MQLKTTKSKNNDCGTAPGNLVILNKPISFTKIYDGKKSMNGIYVCKYVITWWLDAPNSLPKLFSCHLK